MLEHDLTKRANMTQVSQSSWLKQEASDFHYSISADEGDLLGIYHNKTKTIGSQTECVCIYDSLHFSSEHN